LAHRRRTTPRSRAQSQLRRHRASSEPGPQTAPALYPNFALRSDESSVKRAADGVELWASVASVASACNSISRADHGAHDAKLSGRPRDPYHPHGQAPSRAGAASYIQPLFGSSRARANTSSLSLPLDPTDDAPSEQSVRPLEKGGWGRRARSGLSYIAPHVRSHVIG
jgi:hypothetical protein